MNIPTTEITGIPSPCLLFLRQGVKAQTVSPPPPPSARPPRSSPIKPVSHLCRSPSPPCVSIPLEKKPPMLHDRPRDAEFFPLPLARPPSLPRAPTGFFSPRSSLDSANVRSTLEMRLVLGRFIKNRVEGFVFRGIAGDWKDCNGCTLEPMALRVSFVVYCFSSFHFAGSLFGVFVSGTICW